VATLGFSFGDPKPSPDNFDTFNPQDVFADSGVFVTAVPEAIPAPWRVPPVMSLDEVLGAASVQQIQMAGQIVFHSIGDSGGVHSPQFQFSVGDALTNDLAGKTFSTGRPAMLYHLGDVVYFFGQTVYYFDQFYDPYRNYDGPILAIPGNHDGVMFPKDDNQFSLESFWNNFCSMRPVHRAEAQSCARTTMTQPGVYFTLDAPFVKVIGLYSNTSETVGTLHGPNNNTQQLAFLTAQLQAAVAQRKMGDQRALIFAVHHPPFTGAVGHFPSPALLADLDAACTTAGIMPDLVLSGHSHLYERYNRTVGGRVIPYVVAGNGGFYNLAGLKKDKNGNPPTPGISGTDGKGNPLTLKAFNEDSFGFLRVAVSPDFIFLESVGVNTTTEATSSVDSFTVDLTAHTVTDGIPASHAGSGTGAVSSGGGGRSGGREGASGGTGAGSTHPAPKKPHKPLHKTPPKKR
jgi:predicted phosphodiesterase